jgi:exonuclease SbcC
MNALFIRIAPFFFKPSLEHRNPDVRLLALERLQLENAEHQSAFLEWLRQEQNESLLESALKLFPHTSALIQLLNDQQESESALAKSLCRHLAVLLASEHQYTTAERQDLVSQIQHTPLQLELIRTAEPLELRLSLLEQLQADEEHWLDIALGNTLARVRLQAAETISSETALEKLLREAQGDKRVQRLARDRLNAYRAAAQAEADTLEQRHKLLEQLQRLVDSRDERLFAARLEHLIKQWQSLDLAKTEDLQQRFDQLCHRAETFIQQLQTAEAERLAVIAQQQAAEENRQQLQQQLEDLIQQLQAETPLATISDNLQAIQNQWQNTLQQHPVKPQQQQNFQQRFNQANTLLQAVDRWQQLQPALEQLLQSVTDETP